MKTFNCIKCRKELKIPENKIIKCCKHEYRLKPEGYIIINSYESNPEYATLSKL